MESVSLIVAMGALAGGFVSGLVGFGTALTVLPIWLLSIQPTVAAPLAVICALVAQVLNLPFVWRSILWRILTPFLMAAFIGIPVGTFLLRYVSIDVFRLTIGFLLFFYSSVMLAKRSSQWTINGSRIGNLVVGFSGGVLGGIAGLSGILPTIWITLHRWDKATKRGFFQGYNLVVLGVSVVFLWLAQYITVEVLNLLLVALPGTLVGAWLGRKTYANLNDDRFDLAILFVLLFSGLSLIVFWLRTHF